jgi:hypothetical protein
VTGVEVTVTGVEVCVTGVLVGGVVEGLADADALADAEALAEGDGSGVVAAAGPAPAPVATQIAALEATSATAARMIFFMVGLLLGLGRHPQWPCMQSARSPAGRTGMLAHHLLAARGLKTL